MAKEEFQTYGNSRLPEALQQQVAAMQVPAPRSDQYEREHRRQTELVEWKQGILKRLDNIEARVQYMVETFFPSSKNPLDQMVVESLRSVGRKGLRFKQLLHITEVHGQTLSRSLKRLLKNGDVRRPVGSRRYVIIDRSM